MDKLISVLNRL